jgi:hypothetical protein
LAIEAAAMPRDKAPMDLIIVLLSTFAIFALF